MTSYAYLGPRGTFAETALRLLPAADGCEHVAFASVGLALAAVRRGEVAGALVPIENSIEGSVPSTLDDLASGDQLQIIDEVTIPVRFALIARPGTELASVKTVATHPHAEAQTRGWLYGFLPGVTLLPALSTAAAVQRLAEEPQPYDAAVAAPLAAELYGMQVLVEGIADNDEASTRFVLVSNPGPLPSPTGADKTTLFLYIREDHPGALLEILTEFAVRGVNLTRIESRPTKRALGDYYFSVDVEGHVADERVGEALMGLQRVCADIRFLGSYARHDGKNSHVRIGTSDENFRAAREWLGQIRQDG
ncbi:MAG: prephenate dehydratase [Actinomycetes bacterium]